ncbi:hypothetical protein [Roseovarius sp. MMSF_3305]|uniref:hypothetical protein n=1 Tax=Roseovarius sp. MMSF_3305 TaxID=3046697 RepID=UPI00273E6464|nr:hypothetical protein [Roseovarius sp. MMSF_3305]
MNPKAHHCLTLFENKDRRRVTTPEGADRQCHSISEDMDRRCRTEPEGRIGVL